MNKLWLIIKREYITRVTKKSFILATLLTPLGFALIVLVSGYLSSSSMMAEKKIKVVDQSGVLKQEQLEDKQFKFALASESIEEAKENYRTEGFDLLVEVPRLTDLKQTRFTSTFYSEEKPSLIMLERIERKIGESFREYKIQQSDIDQSTLDELKVKVNLENGVAGLEDGGSSDKSSRLSIAISTGLSYIMGFMMYMVIFIYGGMVMRSVMEEKINRIVEVMISSVKPFQLMLGKITGVGLVGLTQLGIWLILIPLILVMSTALLGGDVAQSANSQEAAEMMKELENNGAFNFQNVVREISALNWWLILPSFVIFFLGGYFIYSSLFAAVGSAIGDDLGEGQQLMLPIIVPVILGLAMIPAVFNDPDGPIAVFGSMFPLFSPIIMPARLPFDPPLWQVMLSIVILIASVIFMAWLAGRIYRVGILMYGKKVSFKELGKWLFYKG